MRDEGWNATAKDRREERTTVIVSALSAFCPTIRHHYAHRNRCTAHADLMNLNHHSCTEDAQYSKAILRLWFYSCARKK